MRYHTHTKTINDAFTNIYSLGDECLKQLQSISRFKTLKKGEYFSKMGESAKDIGCVINGVLRVYYLSEAGKEHNKNFLTAKGFLSASIDPNKASVTNIQAITSVTLALFSYSELAVLFEKYRQIGIFFQKLTLDYLEKKQAREICLLANESIENYRLFLHDYPGLVEKISLYHVASYLGISPTQLSRIRKHENTEFHQHM